MNLGLAIKTLRKNNGYNQTQFCDKIGITQSYLSQLENGHKEPSMDVLKNISIVLNTPIAILFWFTLTEDNIDKRKVESYKMLKPHIDELIKTIFNN